MMLKNECFDINALRNALTSVHMPYQMKGSRTLVCAVDFLRPQFLLPQNAQITTDKRSNGME